MATYFYGAPDIQTDGLQTLYLMNPGFFGYPEAPASANMVLLNSAASSLNPASLPHNLQQNYQTQHLVGVPLQPYIHGSQEISSFQDSAPRLHHSLWTPTPSNNSMDMSSQLDHRRSPVASSTQQGSSVSPASTEGAKLPGTSSTGSSALMGSKYLKAAQQLLDEVVSVGKGDTIEKTMKAVSKDQLKPKPDAEHADETEMKTKLIAEITTAERQELQMKKAKLVAMLDEVEQRYRQYRNQMQTVVSSFEEVAGFTSARTYTSLALKTISKQFRCLRDSICSQIQATTKSLGENYKEGRGLRLRFLDHHQRQQRALQQLGMMQHSAWRPQRGLPEHAVSILRAWLFEHFLHPYPKDSDKQMLAKQTGLTRSQVSNWFINARVRLWKPMVEEMYLEESNEHEQNNSGEKTRMDDAKDQPTSKSKSIASQDNSSPSGSRRIHTQSSDNLLNHAGNSDDEAMVQPKAKKARSDDPLYLNMVPSHFIDSGLKLNERNNQEVLMSFGDGRQNAEVNQGYHFITDSTDHRSSFGSYSIGEIGRFDHEHFTTRFSGNSVSLTLGLPHTESLSMSGGQPPYLSGESISLRGRMGLNNGEHGYCSMNNHPTAAHPSYPYESINVKRGERFAAQLMPDFMSIG